MEQLKQEWGMERYLDALGIFTGWLISKQHPISKEQMLELRKQSTDAFDLFSAWMMDNAKRS